MKTINLTAKSKKAKQLIQRFGVQWELIETREKVPCCKGGKGLLVQPTFAEKNDPSHHRRWIDFNADRDFNWDSI